MAKKAKKLHTRKGVELKIVNPDAAGIDIADTEIQVLPTTSVMAANCLSICTWSNACH